MNKPFDRDGMAIVIFVEVLKKPARG